MNKQYSQPDMEWLKVLPGDIVTASNDEANDDTSNDPFGPQN